MAKVSKTALLSSKRGEVAQQLMEYLVSCGEDALLTAHNEFMFPSLDAEGNELFVVVKVTIPRGEQGGEPYDGYAAAENYKVEAAQKELNKQQKEKERKEAAERRKQKQEERRKRKTAELEEGE